MEHLLVAALSIALLISLTRGGWHYEYRIVRASTPSASGVGKAAGRVRHAASIIPDGFQWNTPRDVPAAPSAAPEAQSEIASALVNLGCKKEKAAQVAKQALGQGKDFDGQMRWALQNAA